MPNVPEGIAIVLLAVPGALFLWAFERVAGRWGIGLSDRFLRFIGISIVLQAVLAPATYLIWDAQLRSGALDEGERLPLWLWPVLLGYIGLPIVLGTFWAWAQRQEYSWARAIRIGPSPPTAWDAIFVSEPEGWVLMRLKSGRWVGGQYTDGSYAGGYPEPADIFISVECAVDQDKEEFVSGGTNNQPIPLGSEDVSWGLLVRWDEVEYLEVTPT